MRPLRLTGLATAICLALLIALLTIVVALNSTAPVINEQYGITSLHFAADRAWALFAGDCVMISWRVDGIESLHIEGRGEIGWGEKAFCPQIKQTAARIEVRSPDGLQREFQLRIHFLPDLLLYLTGFVGSLGSLGLSAYFLLTKRMEKALNPRWLLLCLSTLIVIGVALRLNEPEPPRLYVNDGEVAVSMQAEKASLVFPQECLDVAFSVLGLQSLRFNGKDVSLTDNWARRQHCDIHGSAAVLEVVGTDGKTRQYELPMLVLLASLAQFPVFFYLSLVALLLASLVYVPYFYQKARTNWQLREWTDFLALAAFAFLVLMLYLPFGFDSAGHWEEWALWDYAESSSAGFRKEFPTRFLLMLPISPAILTDIDSFIGLHLVQFALLTLQPTLVFGILRKLNLRVLYAFLIAALGFVYPANDLLLSPRFVINNASMFWLLLAAFCALDYLETPRRRTLLGVALALLFNVGSYEAGLAVIVALPFFLWLPRGNLGWRQLNLATLWVGAAVFKIGYIALLLVTDRPIYRSNLLDSQSTQGASLSEQNLFATFHEVLAQVYQQTFVEGWREAIAALADNHWLLPTTLSLLCLGALAARLARQDSPAKPLSWRHIGTGMLGGALLIIPAVSVLMWLPAYNVGSMPRLYFYVPFGAAVAVFCLLLLLTGKIKKQRARDYALIALCLLLMLPALSRLFVQHELYTRSADKKALIYRQILELVPRPHPDTYLLMITPMSRAELADELISETTYNTVFTNAIRTLYADQCATRQLFLSLLRPLQLAYEP